MWSASRVEAFYITITGFIIAFLGATWGREKLG